MGGTGRRAAAWAVALVVVAAMAVTAGCGDDDDATTTGAPTATAATAGTTGATTAPAEAVDGVVLALQDDLIALGFSAGPASGEYDAATRAAVVAFQREADLEPDGIAGPQTHAALDLARGRESSDAVRLLQQAMTAICAYSGPIDGVYGSEIESAVRAYQEQQGLSADGRFGPETARALAASYRDRPASCEAPTSATTTAPATPTPAPSGPTITVSGPSYLKTFHVTRCRNAGETDIDLTASDGAYALRLVTTDGGAGTIAITGGDEQDGVDIDGTVRTLSVGDAGDIRAAGRFAAGSVDGDRSFTVAGRCA